MHENASASEKDLRQRSVEADLDATMHTLFERWPTLSGFSVRDVTLLPRGRFAAQPESGLCVSEVSVFPLHGLGAPEELCEEIVAALAGLLDESPGADDLLRERTFARTIH